MIVWFWAVASIIACLSSFIESILLFWQMEISFVEQTLMALDRKFCSLTSSALRGEIKRISL